MSGRYNDAFLYAFDEQGKRYLISQEYSYAGGGYYHESTTMNGYEYDVTADALEDEPETQGTKLPDLGAEDVKSYFTEEPSPAMKEVLRINGLTGEKLIRFLWISIDSVNAGPYAASCYSISKDEYIEYEHDLCAESIGDEVEQVAEALAAKYAPEKL